MPALPDLSGVARLDMKFGDPAPFGGCRLFIGYTNAAPPGAGALGVWLGQVSTSWGLRLAPMVHLNQSLLSLYATDLSSNQGAQAAHNTPIQGTRSGSQLPVENCVLVNYQTGRRYRGGKPRTYHPGGVAADTTDGHTWLPAFVTSFHNAFQSFQTEILAPVAGFTPYAQMSIHYYKGYVTNPSGSVWGPRNVPAHNPHANDEQDNITSFTVSAFVGSQRRRIRESSS